NLKWAWGKISDAWNTVAEGIPQDPEAYMVQGMRRISEQPQQAAQSQSDQQAKKVPNPEGSPGAPDHQAEVGKQTDQAQKEAKPGEKVLQGKKVQGVNSNRRPDVQIVGRNGRTRAIVEVERHPNSRRHRNRQKEYDRLKIRHKTVPLPKRKKDN